MRYQYDSLADWKKAATDNQMSLTLVYETTYNSHWSAVSLDGKLDGYYNDYKPGHPLRLKTGGELPFKLY